MTLEEVAANAKKEVSAWPENLRESFSLRVNHNLHHSQSNRRATMSTIDLGDWREAEIERYCEAAAQGKETDWIEHDEQSSLEALGLVYTALTQSLYQEGVVKRCRQIIEPLITKYAERRADDMLDDCTCYAPPVRYDSVSPPETVRRRDCPIHGSEDYRRER